MGVAKHTCGAPEKNMSARAYATNMSFRPQINYKTQLKEWCEKHHCPMPEFIYEFDDNRGCMQKWSAGLGQGRVHYGATKLEAAQRLCADLIQMVRGKEPAVQQTSGRRQPVPGIVESISDLWLAVEQLRSRVQALENPRQYSPWTTAVIGHVPRPSLMLSGDVEENPGPDTDTLDVLCYGDDVIFACACFCAPIWFAYNVGYDVEDWWYGPFEEDLTEDGVEPNPGPCLYWDNDGGPYATGKYFPIILDVGAVQDRIRIHPQQHVLGNWKNPPAVGNCKDPVVKISARIAGLRQCPHCRDPRPVKINVTYWSESDEGTRLGLNLRIDCSPTQMQHRGDITILLTVRESGVVYVYSLKLGKLYSSRGRGKIPHRHWNQLSQKVLSDELLPLAPLRRPDAVDLTADGDVEPNPGPEYQEPHRPRSRHHQFDWGIIHRDPATLPPVPRDLTRYGVEPNPGPKEGKRGRANSAGLWPKAPSSPKDSLKPMRDLKGKKPVLKKGTRGSKKSGAIAKSLSATNSAQLGALDAARDQYYSGIPCRDYAAGNCTWGAQCKFNHDSSPSASGSGATSAPTPSATPQPPALCRRVSRPGGCPFGNQCRFVHPASSAGNQGVAPTAAQLSAPPTAVVASVPAAAQAPPTTAVPPLSPLLKPITLPSRIAGGRKTRSLPIPSAPSPHPAANTPIVIQPAAPAKAEPSKEMKEREMYEAAIRRRIRDKHRVRLVFYERVGISNPVTALVLLAIAVALVMCSIAVELILGFLDVPYWSISLLFTIPTVLTCFALAMVVCTYLMAGTRMIRHQFILIKNPAEWLPDTDLRTDVGANTRLDHDSQRLSRYEYTRSFCFTHDEKSNKKRFLRYRAAMAWENFVRSMFFMPKIDLCGKKGVYSEELLSQCTNAHNMSVRTDLETVKDRVSQVVRTKASMPLNRFDQTSRAYITGAVESIAVAVWMDQQRTLRNLPFVVPPSLTGMSSH